MTIGERPRLGESSSLVVAALVAFGAVVAGLVVGFARVEALGDLLWNPRWSAWIALPLGLAALAILVVLVQAACARAWIAEMTGALAVALTAAVAPFCVGVVTLAGLAGVGLARLRR